jgi:hypothetical protein
MLGALKEKDVLKLGWKSWSKKSLDARRWQNTRWTKHKKETAKLWDDILSLRETTNKLQAQLYELQNQNFEYEARFKQMSAAASFRILEIKSSFLDGEPLPWKSDDDKDSPLMTHKYWGSQQSSREVKPKFIDSTQGEPKDIYKP